jgi:SAM-dependent methyltransferase
MPGHKNHELALTFGQEAAAYERGRPGYPDEAVEWILARAASGDARPHVVDVGAGTGKFTASLAQRPAEVTAVEPDPAMRDRLAASLPGVTAVEGSAEHLPLADSSGDLVTMAQAWHWVEVEPASREIARVLRPGGALALVWNVRDAEVPWVAELTRVMGSSIAEDFDTEKPPVAPPLERTEYAEFRWTNELDRAAFRDMVASRSYVIAMTPEQHESLFAELGEFLDTHPDLAGHDLIPLPYVTRVTIARPTAV